MKTKKLALMILGLFLLNPVFSAGTLPGSKSSLTNRIRSEIVYPRGAAERNIEGMVLVSFTVDSLGNIQLEGVNASNPELSAYVVSTIKNIKAAPADNAAGQYYNMKFIFKIL